jgi:Bacterial Ig-like domain (group 3)/Putative Ig domain/Calx-beta domain
MIGRLWLGSVCWLWNLLPRLARWLHRLCSASPEAAEPRNPGPIPGPVAAPKRPAGKSRRVVRWPFCRLKQRSASPPYPWRLRFQPTVEILEDRIAMAVQLTLSGYQAKETASYAVITANLDAPSPNTTTVDYQTSDGTATAGTNYVSTSGTLTFAAHQLSQSFQLPILDAAQTTGLTVNLALSNPTNTALGSNSSTTLTILAASANPSPQTTTTTLASSDGSAEWSEAVIFTASIIPSTSSSLPITGYAEFYDGSTDLGAGAIDPSTGQASYTLTTLTAGTHAITAAFSGDSDFTSSTSDAFSQYVDADPASSTALTSSANPSVSGQSITFTATVSPVSPATGTPTGNIVFKDSTTTLATVALTSGVATFTTSSLSVASHSISAGYGGDANFTSSGAFLTQVVNTASTTSSLSASGSPWYYGASVTFTATVSVNSPGTGTPTGTETFKDGATTIGTATLSSGVATFSLSSLSVGSHSITALYSGDSTHASSTSSALSQSVLAAVTSTTVSSSVSPSVFGQSVTFTATVSVTAGGGTPDGTVTFKDGSTTLATTTLSAGATTYTTSSLAMATHSITAVYNGVTNYATSTSSTLSQAVGPNSSTSVSSSLNASLFSQSVTFTATVSAVSPITGTPSGVVTFESGGATLGTATLSSGTATYTTSALAVGTYSITAIYAGAGSFTASGSSALSQTVNTDSSVSVTSSVNPSVYGQSTTFTATVIAVSPVTGTPSGTVTFEDAGVSIGSGTLSSGQATYATTALAVGTHSITAVYGGAGSFSASTSSAVSDTVNQDATATTLVSGTNPSIHDHSVTYTATVAISGPGTGTPGGSVELLDGSTILSTATLSSGVATFNVSSLSVTTHSLTADYLGATNYATSNSSALNQVVQANTVSVTADSFSATAGTSTGSITVGSFTDNDPTLTSPSSFTATINWGDGTSSAGTITTGTGGAFNVSGIHTYLSYMAFTTTVSVTDTYNSRSGSANNTATVADPVTLTNPGTQTKTEGDSVSLTISHTPSSGVTLTATGLPPGLTFNPSTGAITGTVAIGDASFSPYITIVSASAGGYSASMSFNWTISSPITWNSIIANQSNTEGASISLTTGATDSVSGSTVTYGAVGLPDGLKISTSTGTITGTIAAGAAANGPYTVTLIAGDGTYSINQTFTWKVANPITITPVLPQTSVEGASVTLGIIATDATSGATMVYTAVGLPNGLKINTSTGAITGTVAAGAAQNGPYNVMVTVGDGTASASIGIPWNISSPVAITVPADQTNNEGDSVSLTITATDSTSGTITYGATNLPAGLSINPSTGAITGTVASAASAASPNTVILLATDGTYTDIKSFTWKIGIATTITVADPGSQSNNEGDSISLAMSATDTGGTISSWSATDLPTGLSINSSTGVVSGTASTGGTWNPTITATDGTHSASVTDAWDVSSPITITDSGPQAYNAGDAVSVPITATDTASGTLVFSSSTLPSGLSISSSTGTISGTISSSLTPGNYTSIISVTDGTNTDIDSFGWTIYATSTIAVTNPGTQSSTEGSAISTLSIGTSYSGSGTLTYAAAGLPAGLVINPTTGHITGTPAAGDSAFGPYTVQVSATDGTAFDTQTFVWNVASPLTISSISNQTTTEGTTISTLTVSASGLSGIVYSALGLPTGLKINSSSGAITGTVAPGTAADGPFSVTVVAASGSYSALANFKWTITSPISITSIADQTGTENTAISTLTITATDSVSGATLSYSATGLPPGLQINPSTGAITGTPYAPGGSRA